MGLLTAETGVSLTPSLALETPPPIVFGPIWLLSFGGLLLSGNQTEAEWIYTGVWGGKRSGGRSII